MKTWFTTTANHKNLEDKLDELEALAHTIFQIVTVSGEIVIVSFTTA
jgi:hypothetical protein